ncbi:LCP family protein [Candidatus Saccharibacteria bacterium]|nr:LCP family protein [Candidatus Saccharibacteria bacterium]
MRKQTSSLDGFVPRRGPTVGGGTSQELGRPSPEQRAKIGRASRPITLSMPTRPIGVRRSEIDDSLSRISDDEQPKKTRRGFFRRKPKKLLSRKQKILKRIAIAIIVLLVGLGVFVGIKAAIASGNVLQGNFFDIFQARPLKMDENGRSNVLVFGTSEDDPGHEAAYLTDSILVISIDQTKKDAFMMSIPRDLIVDYGEACFAGYQGKINALYGCYSEEGASEKAGADALKEKVGDILGLDIQYYSHVNYTVVRDTVKALGSIDVNIESTDPRGIMDSNFDWKCKQGDARASRATIVKNCPPSGHFIDFPNGKVTLDAEHALYLAQARGAFAPTYGLERSNFDREVNQQKIVKGIREKAVSVGTLTDVGKVTGLIDALGDNLRTDFATAEVRTLMDLGQSIPSDKIVSLSLVKEGEELVTSGLGGIVPSAGSFEYAEIQAFIDKNMSSDPVAREAANIVVMNGSGIPGIALTESGRLSEAGFTVSNATNAPTNDYKQTVIYRIYKTEKGGTASALAKRYGVELSTSEPEFPVDDGVDFVVIVGTASVDTSSQQN